MIKSKGNSLVKKKERYAVPQGGQNNLFENFLIKFARKEKEKGRKKERKKEKKRKERKRKRKEKKRKNHSYLANIIIIKVIICNSTKTRNIKNTMPIVPAI